MYSGTFSIYCGIGDAELLRGEAQPSSKHFNLPPSKSSAKINSHQTRKKNVLPRAMLLISYAQLSGAQARQYLGLCFLHRETTSPMELCKAA